MWHPLPSERSRGTVTHYHIEYSTLEQGEQSCLLRTQIDRNPSLQGNAACVYARVSTADSVFSVEVGGNVTQFTLRELEPNRVYRVRIAAGTGMGFGVPSDWVQHQTLARYNQGDHTICKIRLFPRVSRFLSFHVWWLPHRYITHSLK